MDTPSHWAVVDNSNNTVVMSGDQETMEDFASKLNTEEDTNVYEAVEL